MAESKQKMKKLLLMGRSGAGKTSMHSIIFANYPGDEHPIFLTPRSPTENPISIVYKTCVDNLAQLFPFANIFLLVHKMDKIKEKERGSVFDKMKWELLALSGNMQVKEVFATSIRYESLYKAWFHIVPLLIPNMTFIKESLKNFCTICDFYEIVLFEKATFLIIAYYEAKPHKDILKIRENQQYCETV